MSYYTVSGKKVYFTKCGKKFTNVGNLDDKNAIHILSLNLDFCNAIYEHAEKDLDLFPYWCKDSADCRKVISIACSKNKKGIAAKKRLAEKFFPCGE